jgi:hypothetical protein
MLLFRKGLEASMARSETKQEVLTFIDRHKYETRQLFVKLNKSTGLAEELRSTLQPIAENPSWPAEWRTWRIVLLGLLGNEIGGIASPILREQAAEELFEVADNLGISRSAVDMIASQAHDIRQKLAAALISIK